jgi:hypothetical protein
MKQHYCLNILNHSDDQLAVSSSSALPDFAVGCPSVQTAVTQAWRDIVAVSLKEGKQEQKTPVHYSCDDTDVDELGDRIGRRERPPELAEEGVGTPRAAPNLHDVSSHCQPVS